MSIMSILEKVKKAQKEYSKFSQEQVDEIFREASLAANNARIRLSRMAVEETGMGIVEDKVIKNHFAAEYIYNSYKDVKTCGVIERDDAYGVEKIAERAKLKTDIGVLKQQYRQGQCCISKNSLFRNAKHEQWHKHQHIVKTMVERVKPKII